MACEPGKSIYFSKALHIEEKAETREDALDELLKSMQNYWDNTAKTERKSIDIEGVVNSKSLDEEYLDVIVVKFIRYPKRKGWFS